MSSGSKPLDSEIHFVCVRFRILIANKNNEVFPFVINSTLSRILSVGQQYVKAELIIADLSGLERFFSDVF